MDRHNSLFFASVWYTYSIHLRVWNLTYNTNQFFPHVYTIFVWVFSLIPRHSSLFPTWALGSVDATNWGIGESCLSAEMAWSCIHSVAASIFSVESLGFRLRYQPISYSYSHPQRKPLHPLAIKSGNWQSQVHSRWLFSCQVRLSENIPLGFFHGFFPLKCAHSVFHHLGQIHPKVWMVTHFPQITNRLGKSC